MRADDPAVMPGDGDDGAAAADRSAVKDMTAPRRMFLRKLTADAVVAGGRLAGSAQIIRRSAAAAGEALVHELAHLQAAPQLPVTATDRSALVESSIQGDSSAVGESRAQGDLVPAGETSAAGESTAPAEPADDPLREKRGATRSPEPSPPPLTPDQMALLESANPAVLGTIQSGGAPQLTASPFHWDGRVFRISALDWTARSQNIQIDPRVSLLITDPRGGLSLSVTGSAAVVTGPSVRDETQSIIRKYAAEESEVASRWAELNANGDRLVIVVVPERMLWRFEEPAWRSMDISEAQRS